MLIGLLTFGPCTVHWTRDWQLLVGTSVALESCLIVTIKALDWGCSAIIKEVE